MAITKEDIAIVRTTKKHLIRMGYIFPYEVEALDKLIRMAERQLKK